MTADDLKVLFSKIDQILRLLSIGLVGGKPQSEQARLLSMAGLQPKEIADLLGTTANTVRVTLSNLRKEKRTKTRA